MKSRGFDQSNYNKKKIKLLNFIFSFELEFIFKIKIYSYKIMTLHFILLFNEKVYL